MSQSEGYKCERVSYHATQLNSVCRFTFEGYNPTNGIYTVIHVCMKNAELLTYECILYIRDSAADTGRRVDMRADGDVFKDLAHLNFFLTERMVLPLSAATINFESITADLVESVFVTGVDYIIYVRNRSKSASITPSITGATIITNAMHKLIAIIETGNELDCENY